MENAENAVHEGGTLSLGGIYGASCVLKCEMIRNILLSYHLLMSSTRYEHREAGLSGGWSFIRPKSYCTRSTEISTPMYNPRCFRSHRVIAVP